jgi:hypothetical protein
LLVANAQTKEILAIATNKGKMHDFNMFKKEKMYIHESIKLLADIGFQGILSWHKNSLTRYCSASEVEFE